jgi:hypothetical protein
MIGVFHPNPVVPPGLRRAIGAHRPILRPLFLFALFLTLLTSCVPQARAQEWALSPNPLLSIGTMEGPESQQLYQVAGAHRLSNGGVGVVNGGSREIRFFGPHGEHLATYGRQGGGPKEFEAPVLAGSLGDTLLIVDRAHHRLTLVHPEAGFSGLARISNDVGGYLNPVGCFQGGQTVYGGAFDMRRASEIHNGMNRAHTFYRSANLDGSLAADFGDMAGAEFFIKDLEGNGPEARPALIPFGKTPVATTSPDRFFFSDREEWAIQVFDTSGRRIRTIRKAWSPASVTAADGRRYREEALERIRDPAQRAQMEAYLEGIPLPDYFPPFGDLLGDTLGFLWVQDYKRAGEEGNTWTIFDVEGNTMGRMTFPDRFRPLEIGPDYVLGLAWNAMDVESVQVYGLDRTGRG